MIKRIERIFNDDIIYIAKNIERSDMVLYTEIVNYHGTMGPGETSHEIVLCNAE